MIPRDLEQAFGIDRVIPMRGHIAHADNASEIRDAVWAKLGDPAESITNEAHHVAAPTLDRLAETCCLTVLRPSRTGRATTAPLDSSPPPERGRSASSRCRSSEAPSPAHRPASAAP